MIKANKIKLGLFFSAAISMIILAFIVVGALDVLQPKLKAITVLDTSVEGLSVGSPVKYLGVKIGQVTRISLRESDGYIDVYFDVLPSSIDYIDERGEPEQSRGTAGLVNLLQRDNASCRINQSGIMGGAFLELTITNAPQWALPSLKITPPDETIYVKSISSHVPNAIQNLSNTLEDISRIDFVKLAEKVDKTLDEADELFNNAEIAQMLTRFNRISIKLENNLDNLQKLFAPENVDKYLVTVNNLERASSSLTNSLPEKRLKSIVNNLDAASKNFNAALPPDKMKKMVNSLESNLDALNKLLKNSDKSRGELVKMMADLRFQLEASKWDVLKVIRNVKTNHSLNILFIQ